MTLGTLAHHQRQRGEFLDDVRLQHRAVLGDHRHLAVLLPQREWRAFGDIDLQRAGIELEHGGVRNPRIRHQPGAHHGSIEEQQRRAAVDAADRQDLILTELLAAVDGDAGDAEAGGIGHRVARIAQAGGDFFDMPAPDDAEHGAAAQDGDGRDDAGAARHAALDENDQRMIARRHRPVRHRRWRPAPHPLGHPLAQQDDRAQGGGFQISLGPRQSHRPSEASSTIHCTSSSNVVPACAASSGTSDVSVMPGWVFTSRQMRPPVPSMRSSKRKSARLTPRQPSATCAASVNLRTSW